MITKLTEIFGVQEGQWFRINCGAACIGQFPLVILDNEICTKDKSNGKLVQFGPIKITDLTKSTGIKLINEPHYELSLLTTNEQEWLAKVIRLVCTVDQIKWIRIPNPNRLEFLNRSRMVEGAVDMPDNELTFMQRLAGQDMIYSLEELGYDPTDFFLECV